MTNLTATTVATNAAKQTEIDAARARCRTIARRLGAASMEPTTLDADYKALRHELESAEVALAALLGVA